MKTDEPMSVDLSQLRTFTDGDKAVEKELIQLFMQQSEENMQVLEKSKAEGDSKAWKESAHALKGESGAMGAETLRKLCEQAQNLDPFTTKGQLELFEQIKREYECVKKVLESVCG